MKQWAVATGGEGQDLFNVLICSEDEIPEGETAGVTTITDFTPEDDLIAITLLAGQAPNIPIEVTEDGSNVLFDGTLIVTVQGYSALTLDDLVLLTAQPD